ncbi:MAG: putative sulfate exporter family transporter [Bdellovibrionota bacterium]
MKTRFGAVLVPLGALLCLYPAVSGALALAAGILIALTCGNPYVARTRKLTPKFLAYAIVCLGAGMNLIVVGEAGVRGFAMTAIGIALTLAFGIVLGRFFGVGRNNTYLISTGTAICGGSAIAAVAPVIGAEDSETSASLGTVFLLNACGLFLFPPIGHFFALDQNQFGLWSALAIHDTSSVVGASMQYGAEALQVATTVKLARALWIVPVAFGFAYAMSRGGKKRVAARPPMFIFGFLLTAAIFTFIPGLEAAGDWISFAGKRVLTVALFLIGTGISLELLKKVGVRVFGLGVTLWIVAATLSFLAVYTRLVD